MAILTVRNLPDEVHRALRLRAAGHGRSTEAEVRDILSSVVRPEQRVRLGDALAALGREIGLTAADVAAMDGARRQAGSATAAEPLTFE